jgi:NAD dependent epimerase/dehydratase family
VTNPIYLITGGSGFLGINLCRYLLAHGHRVRSLDIAPFDYPERSAIEAIVGDVRDREAVERAMEDAEIVVHAAAALPLSRPEDVFSTDVHGTLIVPQSAFSHGVSRVIFPRPRRFMGFRITTPYLRRTDWRAWAPMARPRLRPRDTACLSATRDTAFLCCGQRVSSDPRGWVCSSYFTTGLIRAGTSRSWDPETISISFWTSKTSVRQSTFVRLSIWLARTIPSTSGPASSEPCVRISRSHSIAPVTESVSLVCRRSRSSGH